MSYRNATDILPEAILDKIQDYIEGEMIYIPKREINKHQWGDKTNSKEEVLNRNLLIYQRFCQGESTKELADHFYLSQKTIQKIICKLKKDSILL